MLRNDLIWASEDEIPAALNFASAALTRSIRALNPVALTNVVAHVGAGFRANMGAGMCNGAKGAGSLATTRSAAASAIRSNGSEAGLIVRLPPRLGA
jgi:hypothetical protein